MDATTFANIAEWVSKVIAAAAIVLGFVWRTIGTMVTNKVREQLDSTLRPFTETTSRAIEDLKRELRERSDTTNLRAEQRADALTKRIDALIEHLLHKSA
jgi:hypothetical protein